MGFEKPENLAGKSKDNKDGLKKQIKDITKIATFIGLVGGGVGAEAGGIKVDETVLGNKHETSDVVKSGVMKEAIEPGFVPGALRADKKITTTGESAKSPEEFSFDTPDNGGTGSFNGVSFKVAKKILKK
jgi:hypothetical protein